MKKVAIVGAGWMTKPLVDYLMERCGYFVIVANRTPSKAEDVIAGRSGGKAVRWSTDEPRILDEVVREADLAISMVPKPVHIHVARACLRHGKHMLTTAYEIPELVALDEEARQKGVLILNELGEDAAEPAGPSQAGARGVGHLWLRVQATHGNGLRRQRGG